MRVDLQPIWHRLEGIRYIVLRNYDTMHEDVINGGDIDILCESRDLIIDRLDLVPRFSADNLNNCKMQLDGLEIPIDVRYVGDDYYDAQWETDMLNRKRMIDKYYVIDELDEKYSLIYHILLHKYSIPAKYNGFISGNFSSYDTETLITDLGRFMSTNHYRPVIPKDKGVCFNKDNYELLMEKTLNGSEQ